MHPIYVKAGTTPATPILFVNEANYAHASKVLDAREQAFVKATGFQPKAGKHLIVQGPDGGIGGVLFGIEAGDAPVKAHFRAAQLVSLLPPGTYRVAKAAARARDLINTPSNDLGPQELEDAARNVAAQHGARINVTIGAEIEKDFPLIHAVGMGSPRAPR